MKLTKWLSFIFFLSGLSALIYQVAWQRVLTLYYGVGSISITLIVSVYMAGLGLGALCGGFLAERWVRRIEMYALIELFIGCFGFISLAFLESLGRNTAGTSYILSFFYMTLFLLIPTFLMGMTLPLLTKIFNNWVRDFSRTVSFLYFINTVGAAVGALLASYVLISFGGLDIAIYAAAGINFFLAVVIFALTRYRTEPEQKTAAILPEEAGGWGRWAYFLVFLTGFLAIGYEIVWFRVITVLVKGSPYAFSSILFVYLLGIALGSFGMGRWLRKHRASDKRELFLALQFMVAVSVALIFLGYYYLTKFTPFGDLTHYSFRVQDHPLFLFGAKFAIPLSVWIKLYVLLDVFWWSVFFVLVPTVLMGAGFPLIARLSLIRDQEGRTIGNVYFFNIVGNVLGGIVTGFVLLNYGGTEVTVVLFIFIGLSFGFWLRKPPPVFRIAIIFLLSAVVWQAFPRGGDLYRLMHSFADKKFFKAYVQENVDGIVVTHHEGEQTINYINGTTQGGRPAYQFYALSMESMSYVPDLKKVLVLGFGTGGVVEAVLKSPTVEKVTVVELSDALVTNLGKIPYFETILSDPRLEVVIDDARRHLLRTDEQYDLVISFLVRSTTAYSNNIYSLEFFELVKRRLNADGVFLIWAHDASIIARTVSFAFSDVHLYSRLSNIFCIASQKPLKPNPLIKAQLLLRFHPGAREAIIASFPKFQARREEILKATSHMPINRDWKPYCEYYIRNIF